MTSVNKSNPKNKLIKSHGIVPVLSLALVIPLLIISTPAYARHLSDSHRYADGFNDGSQAAIADKQSGNQFNPICDPTGAHTSDGKHTKMYCTGWANGYSAGWNGNSDSPSGNDNSGQSNSDPNGNGDQGTSGGGIINKLENFCHNHQNLCQAGSSMLLHNLLSSLGL